MRIFFYATTLFSCGFLFNQSLPIQATPLHQHTSTIVVSSDEPFPSTDDEGLVAAWMIETSQVAKDYVEGIDKGKYSQSWSAGDQLFQHIITQDEWTKVLSTIRNAVGKVKSRKMNLQRPAWNPKGLPRGPYMVIEYNTDFEQAPASRELLTLRRGTDGKWRVLTYQVN